MEVPLEFETEYKRQWKENCKKELSNYLATSQQIDIEAASILIEEIYESIEEQCTR